MLYGQVAGGGEEELYNPARFAAQSGLNISLLFNPDGGIKEVNTLRHRIVVDSFLRLELDGWMK